jgi:hypothetical protein
MFVLLPFKSQMASKGFSQGAAKYAQKRTDGINSLEIPAATNALVILWACDPDAYSVSPGCGAIVVAASPRFRPFNPARILEYE